jgi:hypothetical protein
MPELKEGDFSINFGVVKIGGKLSEIDRQCAWQLYTEIITRVAVPGKRRDESVSDFSGEIFVESLSSLHAFFQETRQIMKQFPVGKLKEKNQSHLGILVHDLLADVLRPFLENGRRIIVLGASNRTNQRKRGLIYNQSIPKKKNCLRTGQIYVN